MQPFCFFVATKEVGCGAKPCKYINKENNFEKKLVYVEKILLFFFPPYAVQTSSKNQKVQVKKVILTIFYILNIKSKTIQIFIS